MRLASPCTNVAKACRSDYDNHYKLDKYYEMYRTHLPNGRVQRMDEYQAL
jgi:hypothetical protein